MWIKYADFQNFADDNKISASGDNIPERISILENESQNAIDCFHTNKMIINSDKSHVIIVNTNGRVNGTHNLNIGEKLLHHKIVLHCLVSRSTINEIFKSI